MFPVCPCVGRGRGSGASARGGGCHPVPPSLLDAFGLPPRGARTLRGSGHHAQVGPRQGGAGGVGAGGWALGRMPAESSTQTELDH